MPEQQRAVFTLLLCPMLALGFGIACAAIDSPPPERLDQSRIRSTRGNPLVTSLLNVAESAIEAGELNKAEQRLRRILEIKPHSPAAKLGLARVARLRGATAAERDWLGQILDRDPRSVEAIARLAQLEVLANRPEQARAFEDRALEIDPNHVELLAMQLALSGIAKAPGNLPTEDILTLSQRHPFDLPLQLRAARVLIEAEQIESARQLLRRVYWLADLNPGAGREIIETLSGIDPTFAAARVVPVHVYADQSMTGRPGWEMRLRMLLRKTSAAMSPLISTYFVPVSISAFDTTGATAGLGSLQHAWNTSRTQWHDHGILLAFTERSPGRTQSQALGRAELLGRRAIVRLAPKATESRTLIHEIFHLYGGVHVVDVLDSLMNPSGDTTTIDPLNAEIIRLTRNRDFGPGGELENINPYVDTGQLVDVYIHALWVNLSLRREGLGTAANMGSRSRYAASDLVRSAVQLDDHLAQVSQHISQMLVREQLYAKAATYCDLAAKLFGEQSPKGRQQMQNGERLRRQSESIYSRPSSTPDPIPHSIETR